MSGLRCGRTRKLANLLGFNSLHKFLCFKMNKKNIEKENKEMDEKMNLSAPWMIFYEELCAFFEDDEEVQLEYYPDETEVRLFVSSMDKSYALEKLLPKEKEFGNVLLKITVVPANADKWEKADLLRKAFKDNPAVVNIIEAIPGITNPTGELNFVEFKKEVVQFFADNIRDPRGYMSMLYQDIARDAFGEDPDIAYCTSICDDECDEE